MVIIIIIIVSKPIESVRKALWVIHHRMYAVTTNQTRIQAEATPITPSLKSQRSKTQNEIILHLVSLERRLVQVPERLDVTARLEA